MMLMRLQALVAQELVEQPAPPKTCCQSAMMITQLMKWGR